MTVPYRFVQQAHPVGIPYLARLCAFIIMGVLWASMAAGCIPQQVTPTPIPSVQELVLYNWVEYMPQQVLDQFQAETGVRVVSKLYGSMEEAIENIEGGKVFFDVAVIENDLLPEVVAQGLLAQIDRRNVPNFKNISPNFRDLLFDPDNRYSIPNSWGTTGLLVRSDLAAAPVTRWADLWDPRYSGKILIREQPTEMITIALKSLGYQVNSEDPAQLEEALARLLELKKRATIVDIETEKAVAPLLDGQAIIMVGWQQDALYAYQQNTAIHYILPEEGTMLWGDSFVISAQSTHKETSELFLNFILRPEIGAEIIKEYFYPTSNEVARTLIDPALANDPLIYPPKADLDRGEWYMPLSPQGQAMYDQIWKRFLAGSQ